MLVRDYFKVTEQWGSPASSQQIDMLHTRYRLAAEHSEGRDVVELACGSGLGLPLIARRARRVVGGDITEGNVRAAREKSGLPIVRFDAHALPFADGSFDLALLYESIYYLGDVPGALRDCRRILRPGGTLIVCLPNRERPGFHPSPHAVHYPSAHELAQQLQVAGFEPTLYAAYPIGAGGPTEKAFLLAAKIARALHIIPRTLKGRARVKRILFGRLDELDHLDPERRGAELVPIPSEHASPIRDFKNVYSIAHRVD